MTLMETNTVMNRNDAAGDPLAVARSVLLEPHGLDVKDLNGAIGRIFEHKVDYADLYFQYTRSEGWSLDEGIVKSGSFAIEQGVGVRAVSGDRSAFAYSDEINAQALMSAADATRTIARSGRSGRTRVGDAQAAPARRRGRRKAPRLLYGMDDPIASMEAVGKVGLLQRIEAYARRKDPRVTQVMAGLAAEHDVVMVMRS
ncbi:MAG: metalloprotease TldD, partial [Lautropia mirabilis]|nr:metalloprotease TldD [Lautropia mirabilis]